MAERIWSEPLTDSERALMVEAFQSSDVGTWGLFLLRCYDALREEYEQEKVEDAECIERLKALWELHKQQHGK